MTLSSPESHLRGFASYAAFESCCIALFDLEPEDCRGLHDVLLKLQSLGLDPEETMNTWREKTCEENCRDLIRFLIHVDAMDLKTIQDQIAS
jgi:hypothetical protein